MVSSSCPFNRRQYPLLSRQVGSHGDSSLVYLDSAATMLVSTAVIDAQTRFLQTSCANIHRGAHQLAEEATDAFEDAREKIASFFGVAHPDRVILTHGATESLNVVARGWAEYALQKGDLVVVAADNHHSNIVPWHMLAERKGLSLAFLPLTREGLLDEAVWKSLVAREPKVVALCQQSNVLGFRQPSLARIAAEAQEAGAVVVLDGAQAAGHELVNFDELSADFYAFSAHKMGGMTGVGALLCSPRVRENLHPVYGGGGMAARVSEEGWQAVPGPEALEAGTPPIAATVAWSAALDQLQEAGLSAVAAHTRNLAERARNLLSSLPGVTVLGGQVPLPFESLVSFTVEEIHPHDVGQSLSLAGVMVRAGYHCARPVHEALGARASVRASFAGYSTQEEVDALVNAVALLTATNRA